MKKKKIIPRVILYLSLALLCVLVWLFIKMENDKKTPVVSQREQYQQQLNSEDD